MNREIRKGAILYNGMVRGRRKFLIVNIALTVLYILYMVRATPFIIGKLHGPYEFNSNKFISSTSQVTLTEEIEMKKRADKSIPSNAYMDTSYHDGNMYRFSVKFDSIEETGVKYTKDIENPKTGELTTYVLQTVYMGKIGDNNIPVLCIGEEIPDITQKLTGIFVEPAPVIASDISKLTADGSEIIMNEYLFDTRGIEMELESSDIVISVVWLALLVFLYIRLIRYYFNPYLHPTYKQLLKYGELDEVINDIENQFDADDVYREGKELISIDWIMTKDIFKNKIVRNHRTRGRYS